MSAVLLAPCGTCARGLARVECSDLRALPELIRCQDCQGERRLHASSCTESGGLRACVACAHPELFTQKRFPRPLAFAIVIAAALLAPFTPYYSSLIAAAALDALLFWLCPDEVVCYVCGARHRGFGAEPRHPRFDREIEERLKYGERAIMGKPMRPGGTAGAPEPHH